MHNIPWFSTFTLFSEIVVTGLVLYIFFQAYKYNRFLYGLAGAVVAYEILVNISYMFQSLFDHTVGQKITNTYYIILAAFHGSFSLLMFLLLLVFMFFAWRNYKKGINYFREHYRITAAFLISWMVAVVTGILFYILLYLK